MIHIVWEHMIAVPGPRYTEGRFRHRLHWHAYRSALDLWVTNPLAVQSIWDLWDEGHEGAVFVTYLPEPLWGPLNSRLAEENIPHARLLPSTVEEMAHLVALRPDITQLIDGAPAHQLRYGPKGLHIPPASAHLIGRIS